MRRSKIAGMIFVVVVGGCGGEQASGPSADEVVAGQEGAAEQEEPELAETTAEEEESGPSVGDTVAVGDVEWTITEAEQFDQIFSNRGEREDGNFVIVDIILANGTNQDITLATPFFTLIDGQGREVEPGIEYNFTYLYPEENMFVDQIDPGTVKEGKIIFAVYPGASDFELQVGEARFAAGGETESIDLGV